MSFDDYILTNYILGTKKEIESYKTKQTDKETNHKTRVKGNALLLSECLVCALTGNILIGPYVALDLGCKIGNYAVSRISRKNKPLHSSSIWDQPGLIGTVRELYQKYKIRK